MLALILAYAALDWVRNVRRYRQLGQGTRTLYRRRFYRDTYLSSVYFVVSFGMPALVVGIVDSAVGFSPLVQWLLLFAVIDIWALFGPRLWRKRVHPWLVTKA